MFFYCDNSVYHQVIVDLMRLLEIWVVGIVIVSPLFDLLILRFCIQFWIFLPHLRFGSLGLGGVGGSCWGGWRQLDFVGGHFAHLLSLALLLTSLPFLPSSTLACASAAFNSLPFSPPSLTHTTTFPLLPFHHLHFCLTHLCLWIRSHASSSGPA